MLTQVDVSRLPSYQWGREDTLKELEALIAEKDSALQQKDLLLEQGQQEKQQQTLKLIKKMHLAGMSAAAIADLLELAPSEIEQQLSLMDYAN